MNHRQEAAQILRSIVEDETAGLFWDVWDTAHCIYCKAESDEEEDYDWDVSKFEHKSECPVRRGRELLEIEK